MYMKKIRKALSLLLACTAAITAIFCGSVTASAASTKTALVKTAFSQIDSKAEQVAPMGKDLYYFYSDTYSAVYRIGSEELKNWRSTGKLKATRITVDPEIAKHNWSFYINQCWIYSDLAVLYTTDSEEDVIHYVVKYDEANKKITKVYSTKNLIGVSDNGSMSEFIYDKEKDRLTVRILNSKAKLVKKLEYDFNDRYGCWRPFNSGGRYAYVTYTDNSHTDGEYTFFDENQVVIDRKGNAKIAKKYEDIFAAGNVAYGSNYRASERPPLAGTRFIYLTSTDKEYMIDTTYYFTDSSSKNYWLNDFGEEFYGTKAVGTYIYTTPDEENRQYEYKYALVDIKNDKFLSAKYDRIYTKNGGKMFSVMSSKGKCGFMNIKGKVLASFDDAGSFFGSGKYAPVIKSGKIYLVDSNMKQVSKTIKADDKSIVYTLGDEIFMYTYNDKLYFMTNKS